jgi:hypothetical protein
MLYLLLLIIDPRKHIHLFLVTQMIITLEIGRPDILELNVHLVGTEDRK